jgi:hypothetical protein
MYQVTEHHSGVKLLPPRLLAYARVGNNLHAVCPTCLFISSVYGMKADRWKLAHGPVPLYKTTL